MSEWNSEGGRYEAFAPDPILGWLHSNCRHLRLIDDVTQVMCLDCRGIMLRPKPLSPSEPERLEAERKTWENRLPCE